MDAMVTAVRIVVDLLVRGEFDTLEQMTRQRRLTADQLEQAINDYGQVLVPVPESDWAKLDVVRIAGVEPPRFHVAVDLWTQADGRSDLTVELLLHDIYGGAYDVEILGIHTL